MNVQLWLTVIQVVISLVALVGGAWWCFFARRIMLNSYAQGEKLTEEIKATREVLVAARNKEILKRL